MPELQKDKPDRTVWVAIIGAIAVIAAAIIAKVDFSDNTTQQPEVRKETLPQQSEPKITPKTSLPNPTPVQEIEKPIEKGKSPLEICFEAFEDGKRLKNCEIRFEGYSIRIKTDNSGCANIPSEIISHEKSISSYTVRATLLKESVVSEYVEIGLSESSTYKIKFRK